MSEAVLVAPNIRTSKISKGGIPIEIVLTICLADGSEFHVDGEDTISFYHQLPNKEVTKQGNNWKNGCYFELLNALSEYNFLSLEREDSSHDLEYRDHSFAFENSKFKANEPIYLTTNNVVTIIAT